MTQFNSTFGTATATFLEEYKDAVYRRVKIDEE